MLDEPEVGEKFPHCHARRRKDGQTHCRGDLSRRRPGSVGSAIRWPPVLVSMHESPQFLRPGELPQERRCAIWAGRQASTIAGDIASLLVRWYGSGQRLHRTSDRADRPSGFDARASLSTDPGI